MRRAWYKVFDYAVTHQPYFQYAEQFSNSPYSELVDKAEIEAYFEPFIQVIVRGIEQKIIKNVDFEILSVFIFYPVLALANPKVCKNLEINQAHIDTAFTMAWDAIRR